MEECSDKNESNSLITPFSTLSVNIDNSTFLNNLQNTYLQLFEGEKVIFCEKFATARILSATVGDIQIEQKNAFLSSRLSKNIEQLAIGEQCDKTMNEVLISNGFVPGLNLFGNDSKLFKVTYHWVKPRL